MSRVIDRGAVTAAYVGIGMAVTIVVSFLIIIPIEPVIWLLTVPAGLLIGYYANQRSDRRAGPWSRIVRNGIVAGADTGYPDFNRVDATGAPIPPACATGGDCVYARYLALGRGPDLQAAGVRDAAGFGALYWSQQWSVAGALLMVTTASALGGAALYGAFRPKTVVRDGVATDPA